MMDSFTTTTTNRCPSTGKRVFGSWGLWAGMLGDHHRFSRPSTKVAGLITMSAAVLLAFMINTTTTSAAHSAHVAQGQAFVGAACAELLANGDLESATAGNWRFGATVAPGLVVSTPVHNGNGALRLGIPATGSNTLTHATAYQIVTIPTTAKQLTLRYWERPGSSGDANDRREILVLNGNFNVMAQLDATSGNGDENWHERTFALLDILPNLAGQTVVLYWNVYNNGGGTTLVNYLDDLSLQVCDGSATPTPTGVVPSVTPTATPTVASTPDPIRVRIGTVGVGEGSTTATVPLDVIVLAESVNVGVLSANISYDAARLTATGCTAGELMDLLLCNVATPGLVQVAGVSALGIRGTATVADLTFTLLQNSDRAIPLAVEVKLIGDGSGAAANATPLNGAIDPNCTAETGPCESANTIYLPVIQR